MSFCYIVRPEKRPFAPISKPSLFFHSGSGVKATLKTFNNLLWVMALLYSSYRQGWCAVQGLLNMSLERSAVEPNEAG
jgi:hypothetical protein